MKNILLTAVKVMMVTDVAGIASAAPPSGFVSITIVVNAQITAVCQETHASFPDPITIDTLAGSDQTFLPTSEETLKCSNGTVFTVKVSNANGTAVDQACTSSSVSSMALMYAGTPGDTIVYTFMCAGDTNGTSHFMGMGNTTRRPRVC